MNQMKPEGCGPNHVKWGNKCIRHELPNLGTNYVPSVENKAGCDHIEGLWDKKHGICIWSLHPTGGWTAPVKGVYFSWMHGPTVAMKGVHRPEGVSYDEYFKSLPKIGEVKACHVYGDPFYGNVGGGIMGGGMCYHWLIDKKTSRGKTAEEALSMAEKVKNGQADLIGLKYFTKDGKPAGFRGREVVASDNAQTVKMIYNNLNLEQQAPFSLRYRRKK